MKVEFSVNSNVDGYPVDIILPKQKVLVRVLSAGDINFDRFTLSGIALLDKRTYESFTDYKSVFLNGYELINLNDHMNRVNYLVSNGIENNNTSTTYDFTGIPLSGKEEVEPIVEETPEVVPEVPEEEIKEEAEEEVPPVKQN